MKPAKDIVHVFIVRLWIEPREAKDAKPIWRGVIEHIETERVNEKDEKPVYFDHLDKVSAYFAMYLQKIGIKIDNPGK